jgi:nicotinate-nucleotide adenylyltransferase
VHRGHLTVATRAADQLRLDEVRFVPARAQPLKTAGHQATADDRVAMLRAALEGTPRFRLDLREIRRPGPSYTVDTLRELKVEHPADQLFLIVGADAARDLPRWRDAADLPVLATLVVAPRPGGPASPPPPGAVGLAMDPIDVSASAVRSAASRDEVLTRWVPEGVAAYIGAHRLYHTGA